MDNKNNYLERSKAYKGFHYSILSNDMIQYLHRRVTEMLSQLIPVLEENEIRYSICGGTLLGAVTRGNWFDWDEDLDIAILEEDYHKMQTVVEEAIKTGIIKDVVLNSTKEDPNYYHDWVKLVDVKSHVYPHDPSYKYNGVWIDLYKLMRVNRTEVPYLIAKGTLRYYNNRMAKGGLSREEGLKRIKDLKLDEKIEEGLKLKSDTKSITDEVYLIWSASKVIIEKEWLFPLKYYTFNGIEVKGFGNPDGYLKNHYGDNYRDLPPDDLRRVGINKVEFKAE